MLIEFYLAFQQIAVVGADIIVCTYFVYGGSLNISVSSYEHLLCEERLRELGLLEKAGGGGILSMSINTLNEGAKKMNQALFSDAQ